MSGLQPPPGTADHGSSSTSITPSFFSNQSTPDNTKKKQNNDAAAGYFDNQGPPPPYTPNTTSDAPSAPPLDAPEQFQYNNSSYPPQGYHNYGAIQPQQQPGWIFSQNPYSQQQQLQRQQEQLARQQEQLRRQQEHLKRQQQGFVSPPPHPPSEYDEYSRPRRYRGCCEVSVQYFFYFICICLVVRLISLLNGGHGIYFGRCDRGVVWQDLPKRFEFQQGLNIRVVGGHLSNGHITIQASPNSTGLVTTSSTVSSLHPDLSATLQYLKNGTLLEIYVPQGMKCVTMDAVIHVPINTEVVWLDVQNTKIKVMEEQLDVKHFLLQTSNQAISFLPVWKGKNLALGTTNAKVEISQPIVHSETVVVTTTNAAIRIRSSIEASKSITLDTTNGAIEAEETLESETQIKAITTNGHIQIKNVTTSYAELRSSNGRVEVEYAYITDLFNVRTSNDKINLGVWSSNHVQLLAFTTNGNLYATMPHDWQGTIDMKSSSAYNTPLLDYKDWTRIVSIGKGYLQGHRYPPGVLNPEYPVGSISVGSTNAKVSLEFRRE